VVYFHSGAHTPGGDDPADVCREKRGFSVLRGADRAADTFEGLTDYEMAGRGMRVAEAGGLMRFRDRRKPTGDGARCQGGGGLPGNLYQ